MSWRFVRGVRSVKLPRALLISGVLTGLLAAEGAAGTFTVFGPEALQRGPGEPETVVRTFSVLNPNTFYFIRIRNGGSTGGLPRVSSAIVSVNGSQVVGPAEFNQQIAFVENALTLNSSNQIAIEIRSKPGAALAIKIFGTDDEPPGISATVTPAPNAAGWNNTNVVVSFACTDVISGIAVCPEPVAVTTESAGHLVTGTAVDNAGNTTSTTVTVRLDRTPPGITRTWPPADPFSTDRASVEVEGSLTDNLSGVHDAILQDPFGTTGLTAPGFVVVRPLQTDMPPGATSRETAFEIRLTDRAGNLSEDAFVVFHTQGPHMLPTDPARTELLGAIRTSVDRALVQFQPSVSRDRVHELSRAHGGRVAGYLPTRNIALVIFGTERVSDLEQILQSLAASTDVVAARAVVFMPVQVFDNDLLSSGDAIAYRSIRLSEAANFTISNNLPLSPVNIAVIDSGLDLSFGQNNEFDGVNVFDLCAPAGAPTDNTGHGTKLTGVIAAANNGSGNNGVIRGIPGSLFVVNVFRTECSAGAGGMDGALMTLAMELIVEGSGTLADVKVVNLAFGLGSDDPHTKTFLASFFVPYFRSSEGDDILWVASAGNNNRETTCDGFLMFPAGLACTLGNVVSVGGYDPVSRTRSTPSNFGSGITLFAPGQDVHTAVAPNTYGPVGGTSAATALVSGAAALLVALNPQPPSTVRAILRLTAQPLTDPDLPQGGLDVLALIQAGGFPPLSRIAFSGSSGGGLELPDARPLVAFPGLAGFLLDFDDDDHHIDDLWVGFFEEPVGTALVIDYSDDNDDDNYTWTVDRQELPPGTTVHEVSGTASGAISRVVAPAGSVGVPVLLGFGLTTISGGDHHLDRLRVELFQFAESGLVALMITFQDDGNDVTHQYRVAYALVPPDRVRNFGTLSGSSGGGSAISLLDADQPVLQGVSLNFSSDDHHVDQVGVRLEPGVARIWYNDRNDDDDFDWSIRWADVR